MLGTWSATAVSAVVAIIHLVPPYLQQSCDIPHRCSGICSPSSLLMWSCHPPCNGIAFRSANQVAVSEIGCLPFLIGDDDGATSVCLRYPPPSYTVYRCCCCLFRLPPHSSQPVAVILKGRWAGAERWNEWCGAMGYDEAFFLLRHAHRCGRVRLWWPFENRKKKCIIPGTQ